MRAQGNIAGREYKSGQTGHRTLEGLNRVAEKYRGGPSDLVVGVVRYEMASHVK